MKTLLLFPILEPISLIGDQTWHIQVFMFHFLFKDNKRKVFKVVLTFVSFSKPKWQVDKTLTRIDSLAADFI